MKATKLILFLLTLLYSCIAIKPSTRGATKRATAIFKDCIDLSQAHAYGHFMYKSASFEIEFLPSAVLPIERYEDDIKSFLRKISKL